MVTPPPAQSVPHQGREGSAGSWVEHDSSPGNPFINKGTPSPSPIHQTNFLPLRAGLKLVCQRPPEAEKRRAGNPLLVVQTSSSLQSVCPGDISQSSSVQEAQQGGQYLISGRITPPQARPDSHADFDCNLCLSGKCGTSFHFIRRLHLELWGRGRRRKVGHRLVLL